MKFISSFNKFLENTVNLNDTRFKRAEEGINTITSFIENDEVFGNLFIDSEPQGSFRQETIIKPQTSNHEFDVDLMVELVEVPQWEPKDYLNNLASRFKKSPRYENIVDTRNKNRCVTINYASTDFHIDIVPVIIKPGGYYVMNRSTNLPEQTDGDGYAEWFSEKNRITGNKYLTKVVRVIKYIRDSQNAFEAKSILLTTLLGNQVQGGDDKSILYCDFPTALITIISRLDDYLQVNPIIPIVSNPVLGTENFNRKWDQGRYDKFKTKIHEIRVNAEEAFLENDEVLSIKKWQKVFGPQFVVTPTSTSLAVSINGLQLDNFDHKQELSDIEILSQHTSATVNIEASLYWGRADHKIFNRSYKGQFSNKTELPRHHWLKYRAVVSGYDRPYKVYWQVVNTGKNAKESNQLRGEIKIGGEEQWERSLHTGVHWIECFIVDSQTGVCVCRSGPFYVGFRELGD